MKPLVSEVSFCELHTSDMGSSGRIPGFDAIQALASKRVLFAAASQAHSSCAG